MPIKKWRPKEVWSFLLFWTFLVFRASLRKWHISGPTPLPYKVHPMDGQQKWQRQGDKQIFTKDINFFFFFQIWTLRKGFLFLGKEIKSASRSSMKEIKVLIDASSLYQYLPCPHRQKVPKEKAQCPERAFCFVFQRTGHGNNTHLDLSGNPKSGSPNITNTASSSVKAVNCSLH